MKRIVGWTSSLLIAVACLSSYASITPSRYNIDQLNTFEKTNRCSTCDLSGAVINGNHSGAELGGANLSGISVNPNGSAINLSNANLRMANLSGAKLKQANFSKADATGARFDGADLCKANFYGAIGVNLTNAANTCGVTMPDGKQVKC